MPRVLSIPKSDQWKSAEFQGDFNDASFGYLGSFEEMTPEEMAEISLSGKKKKVKKVEILSIDL